MEHDLEETPRYHQTMERLEEIKHTSATDVDYWLAREVCPILGYTWEGFESLIVRAKNTCDGVGASPTDHFRQTSAMVKLGSDAQRKVTDHFLSRTACYLIAMNGDPAKPEIAAAQAYFAIQTRRMELRDKADAQLAHDERRLELRERVTESVKRVSKVAQEAGVRNTSQSLFHDARYRGLYGLSLKNVRAKKGLGKKESALDRAGPLELSANDFQMNLASQVIANEGIKNERQAIDRNKAVAAKVRQVIADSGSPLPENLPVEPPIKEIATRLKNKKKLPKLSSA